MVSSKCAQLLNPLHDPYSSFPEVPTVGEVQESVKEGKQSYTSGSCKGSGRHCFVHFVLYLLRVFLFLLVFIVLTMLYCVLSELFSFIVTKKQNSYCTQTRKKNQRISHNTFDTQKTLTLSRKQFFQQRCCGFTDFSMIGDSLRKML